MPGCTQYDTGTGSSAPAVLRNGHRMRFVAAAWQSRGSVGIRGVVSIMERTDEDPALVYGVQMKTRPLYTVTHEP